ncbi:MAG: DUF2203 domain-containing protein [Candidatus Omnitrophica bacterium]|nr:DUF2203 domain-containing protein [Candidatus Omnitrophota bacterium]
MFKKHFTLVEARQQLPLVKSIVADILTRGQMMKHVIASHGGKDLPIAARRIIEEIETLMAELERMGCYYKDWNFEHGLVDFPAIVDGKEVLLCWRSDEGDISWFHGAEDGYASRKPLPVEWLIS